MEARQRMETTPPRKDESYDVCREKLNKLRMEKMKSSGAAQWRCRLMGCVMLVVVLCISFPSAMHKPAEVVDRGAPPGMKPVAFESEGSDGSAALSREEGGAGEKLKAKKPTYIEEKNERRPERHTPEEEKREAGTQTGTRKRPTYIEGVFREEREGREVGKRENVPKPKSATEEASIRFEVFGKVQGVSFRAYTKRISEKLGLKGWVQNTERGTVIGEAEGPAKKLAKLKEWLEFTGSPRSEVSRLDAERRKLPEQAERFTTFEIRK